MIVTAKVFVGICLLIAVFMLGFRIGVATATTAIRDIICEASKIVVEKSGNKEEPNG